MIYGLKEISNLAGLKEDTVRHLILRGKIEHPEQTITGRYFYEDNGLKLVLRQIDKIKIKNRNFYKFYSRKNKEKNV